MPILKLMWNGFWQGTGFELSFVLLLVVWLKFYRSHGHKFDAEHIIHAIHDYMTK